LDTRMNDIAALLPSPQPLPLSRGYTSISPLPFGASVARGGR